MENFSFQIRAYKYSFFSGGDVNPMSIVQIRLYDTNWIYGARLFFGDTETNLRAFFFQVSNRAAAHYHKDRLFEAVDLLRNEGPLQLITNINNTRFSNLLIFSGEEPAGEGEI